jgi:hypothetical protein
MKKTINAILISLAILCAVDAVTDTVRDETKDIPAITHSLRGDVPAAESTVSSLPNDEESGIGTAAKYAVGASIAGAAGYFSRRDSKEERLRRLRESNMPRHVTVPIDSGSFNAEQVVTAFQTSDAKLKILIGYLCEQLDLEKEAIERVRLTRENGNLAASLTVAVDADDSEKFDRLLELVAEIVPEKLHLVEELMEEHHIGFDDALRQAMDDEIKLGSSVLIRTLERRIAARNMPSRVWSPTG